MHRSPASPRGILGSLGAGLVVVLLASCGGDNGVTPPGPPSQLNIVAGNNQEGTVGAPVAVDPSVKVTDANGRPIAGVSVRFDVMAGGGSVTGDSVVTDADGVATVTEWRLGTTPGNNQLRAQALGYPLLTSINATANPGAPSSIQIVTGGASLTAIVGQEVSPLPSVRVRDAFGNPIPNSVVSWIVESGGGTVIGPAQTTTDGEGKATVGGWRLGTTQGANQLQARTSNGIVVTFTAFAVGIPSGIVAASPTTQAGFSSFSVAKTARVQVLGDGGQPVIGIPVAFNRIAGGGAISGTVVTTDNNGIAALGDWRLGPDGQSTVEATVPGFPGNSVTFTATGTPTPFAIDVRFITETPANLRDAYVTAALRWMEVITADLADLSVTLGAGACGGSTPPLGEIIDDLVIFAAVENIDGPSGILGQAGWCVRRGGSLLSAVGIMRFDIADATNLDNSGRFVATAIHEMGHVLGLGTTWSGKNLVQGAGGADPTFTGAMALAAWPSLGVSYAGALIPVENTGGGGTRDSHWRESVLDHELMTGFVEAAGITMPLSAISVASMGDLGYSVNMASADPYVSALRERAPQGEQLWLGDDIYRGPRFDVYPDGRMVPVD